MNNSLTPNDANFDFTKINQSHMTLAQCKDYLSRYFVPLKDGCHAVFEDGHYVIRDQPTIKKVYFDRMPKFHVSEDNQVDLGKWYFTKYDKVRSITYDLNKDIFYDDKINLCPRMMHQYQKFDTFDKKIKKKVAVMLGYIKEVLSSSDDAVYAYILQWFAHMVKGNKNDSILYLKSKQGFGKSTLLEFMRDHVIGNPLSLETGSAPILSNFNAILGGKLFIYFEELETFSTAAWMSVSSRLKRYCTSNVITLEDKNIKAYTTKNIMNIVVASNNDSIMDDDGRRYFILDVATHRQVIPNCDSPRNEENRQFWTKVRSCFNDEVGHAFYCFLMEVDTEQYRPQDFPVTQSKLDSYAKRMESHENFLKYSYILSRLPLDTTVGELYEEYTSYCRGNGIIKPLTKIDLGKKLKEVGIESYKSNTKLRIKVSVEQLAEIAKNHNWVHDTDEYFDEASKKAKDKHNIDYGFVEPPCEHVDSDEILKRLTDKEKEANDLNEQFEKMRIENESLKAKIAELSNIQKWLKPEPVKVQEVQIKKSVLSLISDDSDEETVEVRLKDNKIVDSLKENDLKEEQLKIL